MPKITIDGQSLDVAPGTRVIEAADRLGIFIPRLCYHPALGPAGACRLCAVSFLEGPVRGLQMSCTVEAADGMVVSTTTDEAVAFRRQVLEWLLANHPHDCPVCDEGGQCLLQEVTVGAGHGLRRHTGRKRTYPDQFLGPHLQQEMNRCIHCYRCRRFYQDVAGGRDFGALGSARRTLFARFEPGPLESPFSGNLSDLCPTGVFTDKESRFRGRRWEFQRAPSLCLACSLGCATTVNARYREVVRLEARFNPAVNGHFLCDRGRYSFAHANDPQRPREARVAGKAVALTHALEAAADALGALPPSSVVCVGSARSSLETQEALVALSRSAGWREPVFFSAEEERRRVQAAVGALTPDLGASLRNLEDTDFALVVGADPLAEAPLAALALRQAVRKGATVAVLDARDVVLPFPFERLWAAPADLDARVEALVAEALGPPDRRGPLAARLAASRNPLVVCGTALVAETTPQAAARAAQALRANGGKGGLFFLLPGANAFGAATLAPRSGSLEGLSPAFEAGEIRGVLLCESDGVPPCASAPFGPLCVVALDHVPTPPGGTADVFLPTQNHFEAGGTYVNQAGCQQTAAPVHGPGTPVAQASKGGPPPREFRAAAPQGEARPAHELLSMLLLRLAEGRRRSNATPPPAARPEHP